MGTVGFFFILLILLGTGKILGWKWSVLVVPTLGLTHGYYDAPSWVWVHLVFSLALLKVIKDGTFRKVIVAYRANVFSFWFDPFAICERPTQIWFQSAVVKERQLRKFQRLWIL